MNLGKLGCLSMVKRSMINFLTQNDVLYIAKSLPHGVEPLKRHYVRMKIGKILKSNFASYN